MKGLDVTFGKYSKATMPSGDALNWRRRVFFKLLYWRTHLLQHNVDIMHVEENAYDMLLKTLLDMNDKTTDGLNA